MGKRRIEPPQVVFSDADADLRGVAWRLNRGGLGFYNETAVRS